MYLCYIRSQVISTIICNFSLHEILCCSNFLKISLDMLHLLKLFIIEGSDTNIIIFLKDPSNITYIWNYLSNPINWPPLSLFCLKDWGHEVCSTSIFQRKLKHYVVENCHDSSSHVLRKLRCKFCYML